MHRHYHLFPLMAVLSATACTITLPATPPPIANTQPVFVSSGPAGKNPIIQSFTANPTTVTRGQPITFQVVAHDPNNEVLQYNWSATGGTLSATTGQALMWTPPEKPGVYTVMVTVTNTRGGFVTGSLNLTVQADGKAAIGSLAPSPAIAPTPTAMPASSPSPAASTAPPTTPSPSATATPSYRQLGDFTKADFTRVGSVDQNHFLRFRTSSATLPMDQYSFSLFQVHDVNAMFGFDGAMGTSGTSDTMGRKTYYGLPRGVYVLNFFKTNSRSFAAAYKVVVTPEIGTVYFHLNDHPLPMPRSNWKLPDNLESAVIPGLIGPDRNPKVQEGAVFLFKYDGDDLDLGDFELP